MLLCFGATGVPVCSGVTETCGFGALLCLCRTDAGGVGGVTVTLGSDSGREECRDSNGGATLGDAAGCKGSGSDVRSILFS